ncbi:MAG TPA: TIGR01777 family oxidoreductase [Candidatus Acidoferrales bacterium]|nr:TIGR01777 family oxidoreductase [Candidatus Acidoferrales bacterium]
MRFVIAGGTGFIGSALCQRLRAENHSLTILTRGQEKRRAEPGENWVTWEPLAGRIPADLLDGADGVINLAGEPIAARRWTESQKEKIRASRIMATRTLVGAIASARAKPKFLLNGSAVGYYGPRGDEPITEETGSGSDFLARTCVEWEEEAKKAESAGVRVVLLRTGIVLGKGGALAKMAPPFKFFVGGPLGSGRQWMPWIHMEDEIGLIRFLSGRADASGPFNATAPNPVTMKEFCRALGRALRRPSWAPVPAFALRILLGEMADMLLTGQRVIPERAQKLGYRFRYAHLDDALQACMPM